MMLRYFFDWAFENGYENPLTIERVDVNSIYCPSNCTWIPKEEQNWNKRNSVGIANVRRIRELSHRGYRQTVIAKCLNIKYGAVSSIINRNYYKTLT
jgi:hypothetical protein